MRRPSRMSNGARTIAYVLVATGLVYLSSGCKDAEAGAEIDTAFLRDTAAGEVVLDSLGRPVPIYEDANEEALERIREDSVRRSERSRDRDQERDARGDDDEDSEDSDDGRRGKKKGKGKRGKG